MLEDGEQVYLRDPSGKRYWFRMESGMVRLGGLGSIDGSRFKDLEDG